MTMTDTEIIAVVKAHSDGKQIEYRNHGGDTWFDCSGNEPCWEFPKVDYRVKPEPPKPREWWLYDCPRHATRTPFERMSREEAEAHKCSQCYEVIHVREVLP